jgi:hypothetical protein
MNQIRSLVLAFLAFVAFASPALAQAPQSGEETAIRTLIDDWYAEHRLGEDGRPYRFHAPGAIDASPGYTHVDTERGR